MAIVKVIELIGESGDSWEDAARSCVKEAVMTIKNVKSVYIEDMQAMVENDKITKYRVNCRLSFVIDDSAR